MNAKPKSVFTLNRLAAAVMSALLAGQSLAGPIGGQVVGGSGSIGQSGATTTINQATQNMAINWQSYNVNVDERVQYIQPNSSSISLNRILSNNGSTIAGRIDANGQVILVNPNGVFFTPTSVVNVGGIIASGLDIAPTDFMNGNYIFNEVLGSDGSVINSGTINASLGGNVALIGKQVENDGLIVANLGTVNLAAGKQAVLTFDNGGLLGVRISDAILQDELGVDPAVMNSGEIHAEGGRVLLTASTSQDVFSQAVNTAGLDRATSVVVHEDGSFTLGGGADVVNSGRIDTSTTSSDQGVGRIVLLGENVTSSGALRADAAGGNGGEIELHAQDTTLLTGNSLTSARAEAHGVGGTVKVLGERVGLFDAATVDVSGAHGGGRALIGGDYQGSNPAVRNASRTLVAPDAQIYADAMEYGNGGQIVTWSDESTWFYGSAYSRGGTAQGDGGLIEISGKGLSFNGQVDTGAENGSVGTVLFDPTNIVIIDGADGANDSYLPDLSVATQGAGDFEISKNSLEALLANASIILEATNDITIDDLLNNLLDLKITTGSITFKADSDENGVGAFVMNDVNDTIRTHGGTITITGADVTAGHLSTSWLGNAGGVVSITSAGGIDVASVDTHGGAVLGDTAGKAGGNVTLRAVTGIAVGSIDTSASGTSGSPGSAAGNAGTIEIRASGGTADVTLSGTLTANGGNGPTSGYGSDGSGGDGGAISISAGQDILLNSAAAISSNGGNGPTVDGNADGDGGDGGGVTFVAGRDVFVAAAIASNGGNGPTSNNGGADGNGGDAGNVTITAARNLSISGDITSSGGADAVGGSGTDGADGVISFNGSDTGNTFNINDNITLAGSIVTINGGGGNDLLVRGGTVATTNTWTINEVNSGSLVFGATTTAFYDIENLTGGAATDNFILSDNGNVAGLINGGGGTDSLTITAAGDRTIELGNRVSANLNVYRVETLAANTATRNELIGDSDTSVNTWTLGDPLGDPLSGPRSGTVYDGAMTTTFSNIDDVIGTVNTDYFTLSGDFAGLIDGEAGADSLTITAAGDRTVELGNRVNANLNVHQVETIVGYAGATNTLIGDSDPAINGWAINTNRGGTVTKDQLTTTFSNFDTISGGDSVNVFTLGVSGDVTNLNGGAGNDTFYISGTVSGVLDAGGGADVVQMYATGHVGEVQLGDGNDFFYMSGGNIGRYVNGGAGNDSFVINGGAIAGAVYGGADNDNFSIGAAVTSLHVDGGAGVDTLSSSKPGFELTLSDAALGAGISATQIENVSAVDGILNANNGTTNTWNIAGVNSGTVNTTSFSGFVTLNGGDGADVFNVSGNGSITGLISGGGGDDSLNVNLTGRTQTGGRISYDGGGQAGDRITIDGPAGVFTETYRTNQIVAGSLGNFDQLGYTSPGAGLDVNYRAVGGVDDNIQVISLSLENSVAANHVLLGADTFEVQGSASVGVNYATNSKTDITAATQSGSSVQLTGDVSLPGTLTVTAGDLLNPDGHTITAGALVFQNTGAVATADKRLMTNVGSLQVLNSGPVYIHEQNDLTLGGLNTSSLLDISAGGSITSGASLISSAAVNLNAGNSIVFGGQTHQLSGPLTLAAGNDISVHTSDVATLAMVSAQNLTLNAGGNIIGSGPVTVGGTTGLTTTGDVNLTNAANDFDIVNINASGAVTLRDANNIAGGSLTARSVDLTTDTGVGSGSASRLQTNTAELTINNATSGGIYVQNSRDLLVSITNRGDIDLSNSGSVVVKRLYTNGENLQNGLHNVWLYTANQPVSAYIGPGGHNQFDAPDIVGQDLVIQTQASDLGNIVRPVSVRVNETFTFIGAKGYVYYYGASPKTVVGTADLVVFSGIMGLSGQQLIDIESLGDVDEAVFTEVRNYYHEDVAVMLPADQRMTDDDDDEERRRRQAVN